MVLSFSVYFLYLQYDKEKKDEGCDEPEDDDLEEELFVAKMARHESEVYPIS